MLIFSVVLSLTADPRRESSHQSPNVCLLFGQDCLVELQEVLGDVRANVQESLACVIYNHIIRSGMRDAFRIQLLRARTSHTRRNRTLHKGHMSSHPGAVNVRLACAM